MKVLDKFHSQLPWPGPSTPGKLQWSLRDLDPTKAPLCRQAARWAPALGSSEKAPSWPGTLQISASRCFGADGETTQNSPTASRAERGSLPVIMKIFTVADAQGKLKNNTMKFSAQERNLRETWPPLRLDFPIKTSLALRRQTGKHFFLSK